MLPAASVRLPAKVNNLMVQKESKSTIKTCSDLYVNEAMKNFIIEGTRLTLIETIGQGLIICTYHSLMTRCR